MDEDDTTYGGRQHGKQESFTSKKAIRRKYSWNDAFTTEVTGTTWPGHKCRTTTRKQLVSQKRISKLNILERKRKKATTTKTIKTNTTKIKTTTTKTITT